MRGTNMPGSGDASQRARLVGHGSRLSALPLRGRERLSELLRRKFGEVELGKSAAVVLRGIAGAGKTRILAEVLDDAVQRHWRTVVAVADPDSSLIPLGPIIDAAASSTPPLLRRAEIESLASSPDMRFWLVQALQDALEQATANHGLVVVVDDLHWYDAASLAVFRTLVPRTADLPILWIFTVRSGEHGGGVMRTLAEISRTAEVLEVGPLRDEAVEDIITDVLGSAPDAAITSVVRRAENIPLLVLELLHGLLEEDLVVVSEDGATLGHGAKIPDRFGASIRERIAHLTPATQTLVHAAAVLGQGFSVSAAAELLNRAPAELLEPLAEAVDADILVDGPRPTFRHQAIREAAEAMIPVAALSRLRRDSARIRIAAGESILAVASSVAEYSFAGDDDSIALLDEAARQLVSADAQGAAELASRAAELTEGEPRFGVMLSRLVPVLWAGGRADEARRVARDLSGRLPPDAEGRMQLAIARFETESSFTLAVLTASRAADIEGLPGDIRAQLLAVKALNLANVGDLVDLEPALARAKAAAAEAGQFGALATVEATESVLRFYENRFDESHRLIMSAQEMVTRSTPVSASQWLPEGLWTAFLANSLGNGETALRIAEGNLTETTRRRDAPAMAFWMMLRARILLDLGRLDEAKTQAEAVMDMAEELQLGDFAHATAGLVLFRVALYQADRAALQQVSGIVRAMSDSQALHRVGNWLAAIAADDDGDAHRALALTDDAYASLTIPVPSMTTPADFGDEIDLIRISVRGGATDRLPTILQVVAARAEAAPLNDLAAGILHHARGLIDDSIEELREAVRRLRSTTRPLVFACALEDFGVALRSSDHEAASAAWEESFDLFDACGAIRDAGRVRQHLRGVGVIRRPKTTTTESGLTTRELQIVERLAQGGTTKQIAADLYLSPHTVITHIRHASTKWNVSSRRALIEHFNAMN